jgi:hypothetical protein
MSWGALGHGQAGGEFDSVSAAAVALWRSVVAACRRAASSEACTALRHAGTVLGAEMTTQGHAAVTRGREWHKRYGHAWVSLYPRGEAKHEKAPHRPELGR